MPRAMGLDVGTKTIGVALSDPLYMIAQSYTTIQRKKLRDDLLELKTIIEEKEIKEIIVGLPKHMNNDFGVSAQRAKSFGQELKKVFDLDVIYQDERMTTISADRVLMETGVRRENRKKHVDAVAATFILQSWLDRAR